MTPAPEHPQPRLLVFWSFGRSTAERRTRGSPNGPAKPEAATCPRFCRASPSIRGVHPPIPPARPGAGPIPRPLPTRVARRTPPKQPSCYTSPHHHGRQFWRPATRHYAASRRPVSAMLYSLVSQPRARSHRGTHSVSKSRAHSPGARRSSLRGLCLGCGPCAWLTSLAMLAP